MKLRNTNQEVAQTLETVATLKEDITEGDLTLPSGPAPNRFAAAVGASVEAASAADIAKAAETRCYITQHASRNHFLTASPTHPFTHLLTHAA